MPIIKPISDLRNKFNAISEICHAEDQPVFITRNGKGDLVVMSISHFERQVARIEQYRKLSVVEHQSRSGEQRISHRDMMSELRSRLNE